MEAEERIPNKKTKKPISSSFYLRPIRLIAAFQSVQTLISSMMCSDMPAFH